MANLDDVQERFIDNLSAIRRKKKLTQKDIQLAQKVISRVENHETDPRLSTLVAYLASIGYDINDIFKEELLMKRPSAMMVEHLNLKLKEEGSCLRYVAGNIDGGITTYDLCTVDKYIDSRCNRNVSMTREFEAMVREFFKKYGAEDTGYTNTVATVFVEN